MTLAYFASAMANHLWQSTVIAGVAGLLALALRNNHARTRHWLWLIASLKFLIPFSVLASLGREAGSLAGWRTAGRIVQPGLTIAMQQLSRPFPQLSYPTAAVTPAATAQHASFLPAFLLAVWICGFCVAAFSWWRRWRRIRAAICAGLPLTVEADLPVFSSPALLEPGVFGIFHPVLLLPQGITDRLTPAHLKAIMAHELCHVRRRDNLTAAIHMAVEAIFWFHPLVWWLGARLVEERERACDEEVLRLGNAPEIYAESILKTCQFYLESPLVCMSGISGADLKKRVTRIMTRQLSRQLSFGQKILLAAAGVATLAGPLVLGIMNVPQGRAQAPVAASSPVPAFEVASIKPSHSGDGPMRVMIRIQPGGRFVAENIPVKFLLEEAYGVKESQISGAPGWLDSEHYDIEAKPDDATADKQRKLSPEEGKAQLMLMIQSLLVDRFKLALHHDTKDQQIYVLVVAKSGPRFHESTAAPAPGSLDDAKLPAPGAPPQVRGGVWMKGRGDVTVNGSKLAMFANVLSMQLGRIVLDKTGLTGNYDFTIKWTPDPGEGQMFKGAGNGPDGKLPGEAPPPPDAAGPSIFTALQEQLGLKLESEKGPVDTIVIDHVERPSEN